MLLHTIALSNDKLESAILDLVRAMEDEAGVEESTRRAQEKYKRLFQLARKQ
ncbi:unnamed protein product, partial [Amoebophrya sp. A25]